MTTRSNHETLARMRQHQLLRDLDAGALSVLAAEARVRRYDAGEVIFHEGEPGTTCYFLLEGHVRVYGVDAEGHELAINLLRPGEIFGEMALFENLPRSASVAAIDPVEVVELDQDALMRCLRQSPALAFSLLQALSERLRSTTVEAERLARLPVPERLLLRLQRLAQLSGRAVAGGVQVHPPLTQQELAALVGTSRESVNRALVRLRQEGKLRTEGGWITLLGAPADADSPNS
jgi:CRP-like cAMP-binding protein